MASLVDKSLVVAVDERYRLLETVREYAAAQPVDDLAEVRARHAAHYTGLAERAEPRLRGPEQSVWLDRLTTEGANLDLAMSPRLFAARLWYWLVRTRLAEARSWAAGIDSDLARGLLDPTAELLDRLATRDEPAALAVAVLGDHTHRARLTGIADRLAGADDPWRRAVAELLRGYAAAEIGDGGAARAERHYTAAARGFRDPGDHLALAYPLMFLSALQAGRGATAEAQRSLSEAMRHAPAVPVLVLVQSAALWARTGDLDRARLDLERAERAAAREDDPPALARVRNGLAELARLNGDTATALEQHRGALALDPAAATTQFRAVVHSNYAKTPAEVGEPDLAGEHHRLAVEPARRSHDGPAPASVPEDQAAWCAARGDRAAAVALLERAGRVRGTDNPDLRAAITGTR
ncbi:hypothetical protein [Saccharothrix lopnurensis]|uniref:Tetratricopeptide repeat protein n=1 Tax=Saccharothrix lopnurensis TaxID=1670621 RepID=A0ABW1NXD0_9PSEU